MSKLVVFRIDGDFDNGFRAFLEVGEESDRPSIEVKGSLPPNPEIHQKYKQYQVSYRSLDGRARALRVKAGIDRVSIQELRQNCSDSVKEIRSTLNSWLKAESFRPIREALLMHLKPSDEARVLIQTDYRPIQRLPWNLWDLMEQFSNVEVSISALEYEVKTKPEVPKLRKKVRILAILGNGTGINVKADEELLKQIPDAELTFLAEPNCQQINDQLWDQSWDILFFAGHSQTEGETGRIYVNQTESLTIADLRHGLKKAIDKGLQLAIFNSCDGLGLAWELEELQIPQVIVMREPVPDLVAQGFLKCFLRAFAGGQSLYLSLREARERLHGSRLDDLSPGVSLLPLIYQNAATIPPTWQQLGRRPVDTCPYRGLFAFQVKDAPFFFGREEFTQQIVETVQRGPLITVIGPSGSGKSSVVFAGLIPHLLSQGNWEILSFRPGDRPFHALALELVLHLEPHVQSENDRLRETRKLAADLQDLQQSEVLRDAIEQIVWRKPGTRLLLVIDQFEELYTLCSKEECQNFLDSLLGVVKTINQYNPLFTLVLTLRADFLGYALSNRSFADVIPDADQMLGPMSRTELAQAIIQPAKLLGVEVEDGLTERILEDVMPTGKTMEAGYLPLVEFTLTQLWTQQQDARLTHAAYNGIGGIKEAIAYYADEVFEQLNKEDKEQVRRIFIQLICPGSGTPDIRRIATRKQIGEENWKLIQHLANVRLLTTNSHLVFDGNGKLIEEETVEIVHEALIEKWFRLQTWLDLDREFRTWQERLRLSINQWERNRKESGGLLRGRSLVEAENWLRERRSELSREEREFIDQSVKLKNRRRNFTVSGLGTIFTIISVAAGIAWTSKQQAVSALEDQINALSTSSSVLRVSGQPFDALLSAMRAGKPILTKQIEVKSDDATWKQVQNALQWAMFQVKEQNRLESHEDEIWSVNFSPDGRLIATTSADGTAKLWSRNGKELETLEGHKGIVASVAFSPDSQMIATASFDKTVKLWNREGKELATFKGYDGWVYSVTFSPDGQTIASASKDGTVKLWNLNGRLLQEFKVPTPDDKSDGGLNTVTFSPDGKTIAASSWDRTVRLWRLEDRKEQTLKGHEDAVNSVSFSPDGKMLVTASRDRTIKLWSIDGQEIRTLKGHTDEVGNASFSPDGKTIVSAGFDKTVRLWNLNGEELKPHLAGHNAPVNQAVFSPDGKTIASAGFDKIAKLWSHIPKTFLRLSGHRDNVWGVSFSPDGKTIATASQDNTIKLWNRDGQAVKALKVHDDIVTSVTFSPNEAMIATTSKDDTVKLWDRDGRELRTLTGFKQSEDNQVDSLSFSPNGSIIAAADWTGTIKLWSQDGKEILTLRGHDDRVYDINFSSNGQMIATASKDKTVKLWSLNGKLLRLLKGHSDQVFNVSFSSDSQTILTSSRDGTIKFWSLNGEIIKTIDVSSIYPGQVYSAKFSPNGKLIAAATRDGRITIWNLKGDLLKILEGHTDISDTVNFSPDSTVLASAGRDDSVILWALDSKQLEQSEKLWNLDLNTAIRRSCEWVGNYLRNNASLSESDKHLCD